MYLFIFDSSMYIATYVYSKTCIPQFLILLRGDNDFNCYLHFAVYLLFSYCLYLLQHTPLTADVGYLFYPRICS